MHPPRGVFEFVWLFFSMRKHMTHQLAVLDKAFLADVASRRSSSFSFSLVRGQKLWETLRPAGYPTLLQFWESCGSSSLYTATKRSALRRPRLALGIFACRDRDAGRRSVESETLQ